MKWELLPDLVQRFITYLQTERHFSDYTGRSYGADLVYYFSFLGTGKPESTDTSELAMKAESTHISLFIDDLKKQYMPATICRKVAALRSFYTWMMKKNIINKNPMWTIHVDPQSRQKVRTLSTEEVTLLLAMPDTSDFLGIRDLAILHIFCATGIKSDELIKLNRDNVELIDDSPCIVIGGKHARTLSLDAEAWDALRIYLLNLEAKYPQKHDIEPLFVNKHGTRISSRSLRRKLDKYLIMADIDPLICPMMLRHTYAHKLIGNGVDIRDIAKRLGHRSHQTTQTIYAEYLKSA